MRPEQEIRWAIAKLEKRYDDPKYKGQYSGFSEAIRGTQAKVLRWVLGEETLNLNLPED